MARTILCARRVFTGEGDGARPLCVAVEGSRVAETFPPDELGARRLPGDEVVDLGDAFLCPGFHDAHEHVLDAALFPSARAEEYAGTSEADCVAHMVAFAASRPDAGGGAPAWLLGHGWRDNLWDPPVAPTRASLDAAFPDRPVAMYSGDGHTVWTNTAGLAALGIGEGDEPPAGGSYDRDASGRLTGVLREAAGMEAMAKVLGSLTTEELVPVYRDYFTRLSAMGVTSVCDMALSLIPGADGIRPEVYEALEARGELCVRAHLFPTLTDDQSNLEGLQGRLTGELVRAPGFKQFFDGVSSQHTAWCSEPYANPRFPGDAGRPTIGPGRMRELVLAAAARGHAVRIHAIGDEAVHQAAAIFAEAREAFGAPRQGANTIEHLEDVRPEDVALIARSGAVASVQPPHIVIDPTQPDRDLGPARAARMWPLPALVAAGIPLALGTDAPVVPPTSQDVLFCAVARQTPRTHEPAGGWHPEHCLGRAATLRAYAAGGAAAVGRSDELGTIAPGMLADMVAWDTDLIDCPADEIQRARALATWVGGRLVHDVRDNPARPAGGAPALAPEERSRP